MKKNKVLIVDDFASHRILFKAFLENGPYEVVQAATGNEAWEFLHLHNTGEKENGIDIILMDLNLQGESGLDVCKKIKSHENFKDIPVLIVTTESVEENIFNAVQFGCRGFIRKPVCQSEILAQIEMVLNWKNQVDKNQKQSELRLDRDREMGEKLRNVSNNIYQPLMKIIDLGRFLETSNNMEDDFIGMVPEIIKEAEEIKRQIKILREYGNSKSAASFIVDMGSNEKIKR